LVQNLRLLTELPLEMRIWPLRLKEAVTHLFSQLETSASMRWSAPILQPLKSGLQKSQERGLLTTKKHFLLLLYPSLKFLNPYPRALWLKEARTE
jgi:hypothetical protein